MCEMNDYPRGGPIQLVLFGVVYFTAIFICFCWVGNDAVWNYIFGRSANRINQCHHLPENILNTQKRVLLVENNDYCASSLNVGTKSV